MAPDTSQAQPPQTPVQAPTQAESPRVRAAVEHLKSILVAGETLEGFAVQRRAFALTKRRTLVAATTGRFIVMERGLFGGFTPIDVRWQDVEEAHIHIGVVSAAVSVKTLQRTDLASANQQGGLFGATGLGKDQAEQVYRVCQAQSQAWREKRRVRDLDELRAKSGGMQLNGQGSPAVVPGLADAPDPVARLKQAKDMLSGGLITDAEFETIKARLVERL